MTNDEIRKLLEKATARLEREQREEAEAGAQRRWDEKIEKLRRGEHVELTEEEKDFIINEMPCDFIGSAPDFSRIARYNKVYETARQLMENSRVCIDMIASPPDKTYPDADVCLRSGYFFDLDPNETRQMARLFFLSDTALISALGDDLNFVFTVSDTWRE